MGTSNGLFFAIPSDGSESLIDTQNTFIGICNRNTFLCVKCDSGDTGFIFRFFARINIKAHAVVTKK